MRPEAVERASRDWEKSRGSVLPLVLGSGPAGQKAAIAASKMGKQVAIVERNRRRAALHKGTIPSKTLREAVAYLSGVRQRELYGGVPGERPHHCPGPHLPHAAGDRREVNIVRDQLIRNYIDVVPGTGSFVDRNHIVVTNEDGMRALTTDHAVIAVRAPPIAPVVIEFDDRRIIDSDALLKLGVAAHHDFVGAGIIGCEYATIFQTMGVRVTIIDGRERPLDFIDDEISKTLYYHMRDEGVQLRFGEDRLTRAAQRGQGRSLPGERQASR